LSVADHLPMSVNAEAVRGKPDQRMSISFSALILLELRCC
jgi:hypothetical protein